MRRDIFTDEHDMFRDAFRTFVEREMVPHREKWDSDGIVDRDLFLAAGAAGFLGMAVPEAYGGAGVSDFRYNLIVIEELCRADVYPHGMGLTLHNDVCLPYFLDFTDEEQKPALAPADRDRREDHRRGHDRARHGLRPRIHGDHRRARR